MASKAHLNQAICSHTVELKADSKPEKEIYIFENRENGEKILTYKNLYENSNKLARLMLDNGIEKGDKYILLMHNHPEFVYALLAGPVIGAIMVPVDPRTRGDRLKYYFKNSGTKGVIVSDVCLPQLEEVIEDLPGLKMITVASGYGSGAENIDKYSSLNEVLEKDTWDTVDQRIMDVRHPMQIIYTSGTTGDPKGVMIRNNRTGLYNIINRLVWKYKPTDVLYTGLSLTHGNAQIVTLFPALYAGIKAVFSPKFTKSRIWDICRKYNCTSFSLLGGMLGGIFNEPEKDNDSHNPVKMIISAGTPAILWEAFEKRFGVNILEWYAAVEGGFAYKPIGKGPIGSFGKTLPGVLEMKIVDDNDNEVPAVEKGNLIFRSIKGETKVDYWNMPEESEAKTRGGWLRTGDIVHKDEDGWHYFDHRKGKELRRSGDFIQPEHVEKIIGEHANVSEVCVYGVPAASGAPGESDLVAAVSSFDGKEINPGNIYDKCKQDLETNFIPSFLQVVDEIPKTVSEKMMDRKLKEAFEKGEGDIYKYEDYK